MLIEKPARGDFLSILDGGFGLQYTPLVEYREGRGLVLFCQLDVTARTESDPAADAVTRNLLRHVSTWKPRPPRQVLYAGEPAGKADLASAGITVRAYAPRELTPDRMLIVGPGGGKALAGDAAALRKWLADGGHLLGIGLDLADVASLALPVTLKQREHIAAYFEPPDAGSLLAGAVAGRCPQPRSARAPARHRRRQSSRRRCARQGR